MGPELKRLKQELRDAMKAIGTAQKTADDALAKVAAKVSAVLFLQEQYDLLESSFNDRLNEEIASLEASVDVDELDLVALGDNGVFPMEWLMSEP